MGLDLGDRYSYVVVLRRGGGVVDEQRVSTSRTGMTKYFGKVERGRVVMEAGGQSAWVSALLEELGHELVVANPSSSGALLRGNRRKNDKMDAAAAKAKKELVESLDKWSANDVAAWWKSWYMQTGHKRLGRILVDLAK